MDLTDALPLFAAAFAIPQFTPQLRKARRTHDVAGVSPAWSTLTAINNAAWIVYFVDVGYWTGVVPNTAVLVTSALLTMTVLSRRSETWRRVAAVGVGWSVLVAGAGMLGGMVGLQVVLTGAFAVQVAPSLWAAFRDPHPTGLSAGTWCLVLGEVLCWLVFGVRKGDGALTVLGITGTGAATAMILRIRWIARPQRSRAVVDAQPFGPPTSVGSVSHR